MMKDMRNANKKFCINTLSFKNRIHISALVTQFVCKPSNGTFLFAKFFFYQLTDVYHSKIKKAEPFVTYLQSEEPPSTFTHR